MAKIKWLAVSLLFVSTQILADISLSRQAELKDLILEDCGACHGLTLKGSLGPSLLPAALSAKSKAFLVSTILNGRAGTAMPAWKYILSHDDVSWIAVQLLKGIH